MPPLTAENARVNERFNAPIARKGWDPVCSPSGPALLVWKPRAFNEGKGFLFPTIVCRKKLLSTYIYPVGKHRTGNYVGSKTVMVPTWNLPITYDRLKVNS